jgi:hypothetical protein
VRRAALAAAVVLAVAAAAWLLLGTGGGPVAGPGPLGDGAGEEERAPHLAKAPITGTTSPRREGGDAPDAARETAPSRERPAGPAVTGVVIDDETGKPLEGVRVVAEISETRCPRLPDPPERLWSDAVPRALGAGRPRVLRGDDAPPATTDAEGAFAIPWRLADVRADLFARRPGWLVDVACAVSAGTPVTIRLKKGSEIRGVVVRGDGRAVAGAVVRCLPAPGTPLLPGHADAARADEEGRFALTGLLPGPVIVMADHPKFVAKTLEPMEPGRKDLRIVLVPAFLATFEITTDDAKQPDAPSLAWKTTGVPPRSDLLILAPHVEDVEVSQSPASPTPADFVPTEQGAWRYAAVRIPCDRPDVSFELKAVGYELWTAGPEPLPVDGGEKTFPVLLRRDLSLGSLRLVLEDKDGKTLSFLGEKAEATPWRRDRLPIPGGIVLKPGDALEFPALPAGPYGLLVRSPLHAPVVVSVDVPAGRATEHRVVVGPPAKLRVRFTAPEAVIVRFRLMLGKDPAFPYTEGTTVAQEGDAGDPSKDPVFHAGAEGLVLTGLAAGRYAVEVLNPDLVAPPTAIDLVEGETREAEVALQKR